MVGALLQVKPTNDQCMSRALLLGRGQNTTLKINKADSKINTLKQGHNHGFQITRGKAPMCQVPPKTVMAYNLIWMASIID